MPGRSWPLPVDEEWPGSVRKPKRSFDRESARQRSASIIGARSKRPSAASSGAHRSPTSAMRAGILRKLNCSMRAPAPRSSHVMGAETVASGRGRGE